jgi:hypothetical protein
LKPALRARAALKGVAGSSSSTSLPRSRASATEPSVEPESTYTKTRFGSDARQRASRSPSLRPMTTKPLDMVS